MKTGNWTDPTVWDVGSGYPDGTDDSAIVVNSHEVTVNVDDIVNGNATIDSGGQLTLPDDRIFTASIITANGIYEAGEGVLQKFNDVANAGLFVNNSTGQCYINGEPDNFVTFRSVNTVPTNKITLKIKAPLNECVITNLRYTDGNWWIADAYGGFVFDRHPRVISPLDRTPAIDMDVILGRDYGRVYSRGREPGVLEMEGIFVVADKQWAYLREYRDKGTMIGFSSEWVQVPQGRILDFDCPIESGNPYAHYSLTIVEDR